MKDNSKEVALAYIAGIIDGEGAIFITRDVYTKKGSVMRVQVRVGMIEKVALQFMYDTFGFGSLIKEKSYKGKRPMHRILFSSYEEIKELLQSILPYLMVKKEQALLALDFIANCRGCPGHWSPPELVAKRLEYWINMRRLNGNASPATTERTGKRGRQKSVRLEAPV